jgi:lysophospholipase
MNDLPHIRELVQGNGKNLSGWLLDVAFATPDGDNIFSKLNQHWYGSILWSVIAKGATGM